MSPRVWRLLIALTLWLPCQAAAVEFDRDIRPLLADRCFACHGPDESARQADLRLDVREDATSIAIVPGDAAASELVRRIRSDDPDERMPPPESHRSLSPAEIRLIESWVDQGAAWSRHWSFVPPRDIEVPSPAPAAGIGNEIDCFVRARLVTEGWQPAPPADRASLLRRLTFSLTGLPPTLAELDAFLADDSPNAREQVVDRLLDSPRYGERMAADWLDVARYSDTYGYQVDRDRFVWPYRDWVVRAFNANMPYDQFVTEQLAGDLLPGATDEQILATTFNRLHPQEAEGGSIPEEFRMKSVADRTETFSTALLGLTMECCRCHDHKFDPLSQKEYYQVSAFFDNIDEAGLYSYFTDAIPTPSLLLPTAAQRARQSELRAAIQAAEAALSSTKHERRNAFDKWLAMQLGDRIELAIRPLVHLDFEDAPQPPNQSVPGKQGQAVQLTGDDGIGLEVGNFQAYEPFSIATWLWSPDEKSRAVVFHRSRAWTDAGSRGYELLIEDGRLQFALIHFWPGNAIAIKTRDKLPSGEWQHVTVTYDGSSRADGMAIYVNGQPVPVNIVRDQLVKNITGGGGDTITIGERFRDHGFTSGKVDEFFVFDRQLTLLEVQGLAAEELSIAAPPRPAEFADTQREALVEFYLHTADGTYQQRWRELCDLRRQWTELMTEIPEIMVMREMSTRRSSYLLARGNYDAPGERVQPETPAVLGRLPAGLPANRWGLARWLTRSNHPLTARVQVNRVWQLMFGQGLVRTPEDFGQQGERPSHPELLDWLANDFVKHGWDVKRLMKQIALSATFAQSSQASLIRIAEDPGNRLLARGPSYRLPAEMLRDNILSVSGLLVEKVGGAPVKPYDLEQAFSPTERDRGNGLYRRSLYTYWKRTGPAPLMTTFDAALRDVCRVRRESTSTPLQALVLLNSPQFVEGCRALGQRLLLQHGTDEAAILQDMFRIFTARPPTPAELDVLGRLWQSQIAYYRGHPPQTEDYLTVGDMRADESLDPCRLAALATVANALLSYDEVQMMR